ncbi:MAG: hypothetical protein ACR2O6_08695 [Ilumatobacteraceae bacterium]
MGPESSPPSSTPTLPPPMTAQPEVTTPPPAQFAAPAAPAPPPPAPPQSAAAALLAPPAAPQDMVPPPPAPAPQPAAPAPPSQFDYVPVSASQPMTPPDGLAQPTPGQPGQWSEALPPQITPQPVESPKHSRGRLFVLIAILALVALGAGAFFVLRGDSGGETITQTEDPTVVPAQFSLQAAAQGASSASTARYEINMSMGGFGALTMTGGIDTDAQIMTFTMDMGAFLGGAEGPSEVEAILDVGNGTMYMSGAGMGFPTDADWISMDLSAIAETSGMTIDDFQNQFTANPLDVAALFTDADDIVDLGAETIDGAEVRHYQVSIDTAAALAANPQMQQQVDLGDLGADVPSEIVYDVWVTEDNQLRRMTFAMDIFGQEMVMEMNVSAVGEPLDVEIPSSDDVMDVTGLAGF